MDIKLEKMAFELHYGKWDKEYKIKLGEFLWKHESAVEPQNETSLAQ